MCSVSISHYSQNISVVSSIFQVRCNFFSLRKKLNAGMMSSAVYIHTHIYIYMHRSEYFYMHVVVKNIIIASDPKTVLILHNSRPTSKQGERSDHLTKGVLLCCGFWDSQEHLAALALGGAWR